jgi:hypothetical protein
VETRKGSPFEDEEGDGLAWKDEGKLGLFEETGGGADLCQMRGVFQFGVLCGAGFGGFALGIFGANIGAAPFEVGSAIAGSE